MGILTITHGYTSLNIYGIDQEQAVKMNRRYKVALRHDGTFIVMRLSPTDDHGNRVGLFHGDWRFSVALSGGCTVFDGIDRFSKAVVVSVEQQGDDWLFFIDPNTLPPARSFTPRDKLASPIAIPEEAKDAKPNPVVNPIGIGEAVKIVNAYLRSNKEMAAQIAEDGTVHIRADYK